jgi:hypothetical protein
MASTSAGATKIMVIRHAEKPDKYNGQQYDGVDLTGATCGSNGSEDLVTLGWQRAGGLVTLFAPPWGPKTPTLATPQYLYAADPDGNSDPASSAAGAAKSKEPSQRPYQTLLPLAAMLGSLEIDTSYKKKDFKDMVKDAVGKPGAVLICWQHEDIPLQDSSGGHGISHYILKETGTTATFNIPATWPVDSNGVARYDLVFVFDRPTGSGPITAFTLYAQMLLAGDGPAPSGA